MSDSSQGPGWWQASDGRWYPPEQHPQAASTLPPPTQASVPQAPIPSPPAITPFGSPGGQGKRSWWRRWWVIAIGAVIALAIVAGIVGDKDQDEVADVPDSATTLVADDAGTVGNAEVTTPTTEQPDPDDDLDQPAPPDTGDVDETDDTVDDAAAGTRDDPYWIGEPVTITIDSFGDGDGSVWTIVVDGPGTDVTREVREENPFNEPPPEDSIFYGVPVSLTLQGADKEPLSTLFNLELEFFGPATASIIDQGFDEGCGLAPGAIDPLKEVFVGGTLSGIVCLAVTEADIDAGVLLTTDSGDGDRIFFATSGDAVETGPLTPDDGRTSPRHRLRGRVEVEPLADR